MKEETVGPEVWVYLTTRTIIMIYMCITLGRQTCITRLRRAYIPSFPEEV